MPLDQRWPRGGATLPDERLWAASWAGLVEFGSMGGLSLF